MSMTLGSALLHRCVVWVAPFVLLVLSVKLHTSVVFPSLGLGQAKRRTYQFIFVFSLKETDYSRRRTTWLQNGMCSSVEPVMTMLMLLPQSSKLGYRPQCSVIQDCRTEVRRYVEYVSWSTPTLFLFTPYYPDGWPKHYCGIHFHDIRFPAHLLHPLSRFSMPHKKCSFN